MLCGRVIEIEESRVDPYEEEDTPKRSTLQVCRLCEAKLRHEADDSQKTPKPM